MVFWFLVELLLNRLMKSKTTDKKGQDKNSLQYIWITIMLVIPIGVYLSQITVFPISSYPVISYFGLILIVFGLFLRLFIIRTLGKSFTVDVTIRKQHVLKTDGFYRFLRHPSYSASLLSFVGLGFTVNNYLSLILIFTGVFAAFSYRIYAEEKALKTGFGVEYLEYMAKSKKLIPFIY